jgi:hypothetical protein
MFPGPVARLYFQMVRRRAGHGSNNRHREARMKKMTLLKMVNALMALLFVNMAVTGVFSGAIGDLVDLVHVKAGYLFIALAALHIILNGAWIKSAFFKKRAAPQRAG